ncbi:glycosyltransferase family 4 protein [Nocardioides sp. MAHUQ-72]|uniref:glycosyltransferase family 4 protein n=1 Tax=unclassified Nocardioides TaxID=2615069 RepID=UPI00361C73FD
MSAVDVRRAVHVVVPEGIDDPTRPSGGNTYDRRVCDGLGALGWTVRELRVPGTWPRPDQVARDALADLLAGVPDGEVVLADGLVACAAPESLPAAATRLRLVVLVHLPLGLGSPAASVRAAERAVLTSADLVVTTSAWTRRWLLEHEGLAAARVRVVSPGADVGVAAPGSARGGRLLCVGAVTSVKGHDVLLQALGRTADLPWCCLCVGALDLDPGFVDRLSHQVRELGLGDRVHLAGPRTGPALEDAFARTDLLVLPSRTETWGMVVTEALAHGIPVLAADVGGVSEALGGGEDAPAGLLVPPDDPAALADALRCWLGDDRLRAALRDAAVRRRAQLPGWADVSARMSAVLEEVRR